MSFQYNSCVGSTNEAVGGARNDNTFQYNSCVGSTIVRLLH